MSWCTFTGDNKYQLQPSDEDDTHLNAKAGSSPHAFHPELGQLPLQGQNSWQKAKHDTLNAYLLHNDNWTLDMDLGQEMTLERNSDSGSHCLRK